MKSKYFVLLLSFHGLHSIAPQDFEVLFTNLNTSLQNLNAALDQLAVSGAQQAEKSTTYKAIQKDLPWSIKRQVDFSVTGQDVSIQENILDALAKEADKQLKLLWKTFSWQDFKKQYKTEFESQHMGEGAAVRLGFKITGKGLDPAMYKEGQWLAKRLDVVAPALKKYLGLQFTQDEMPRIGCAFSGGGYRAMIVTAGFLKALEDIGLLDAVTHISSLSGSTWFVGPWSMQQDPVNNKKFLAAEQRSNLLGMIEKGHFNLKKLPHSFDFSLSSFLNYILWPKVIFEQVISSVDIYGGVLAHFLLAPFGDKRLQQRLSNMWFSVKEGNHPWPLFTAVSMHKAEEQYLYNWYEFNPEIITNLEYNMSIPAYAFNRTFDNGKSTDFPPEQSFGYLMGIFGSAYTVNLKDLKRIMFGGDGKTDESREEIIEKGFNKPKSWAQAGLSEIKDLMVLGAQGKFSEVWKRAKDNLLQIQAAVLSWVVDFVVDTKIEFKGKKFGSTRVSPAQIKNPFKNLAVLPTGQEWLKQREYLTFIDAGIAYNLPLRPLFRPERKLDVVIVGDASGNIADEGSAELQKGLQDLKRFYGITYKKDERVSNKVVEVYKPEQTEYPKVPGDLGKRIPPIIIYFNFLQDKDMVQRAEKMPMFKKIIDDNALKTFKASDCLEGFCGTFNFGYTAQQFKQLSGMAEFNLKFNESILKAMILRRLEEKMEHPAFGQ